MNIDHLLEAGFQQQQAILNILRYVKENLPTEDHSTLYEAFDCLKTAQFHLNQADKRP